MKFYDKQGSVVMDLMSIQVDGADLVIKGKMMGVVVTSIYVRPRDFWGLRKLLSWSVIRFLPVMLARGMKDATCGEDSEKCSS